MNIKVIHQSFQGGCAVSSEEEHFLDTEGATSSSLVPRTILYQGLPQAQISRPNTRPNRLPNQTRYVRLEQGLYLYPKTGDIWAVVRQRKRVKWTNLKTQDIHVARQKILNLTLNQRMVMESQRIIDDACRELGIDHDHPGTHKVAQPQAVPSRASEAMAEGRSLRECWESWKRTWSCEPGTKATRGYYWRMFSRAMDIETPLRSITTPKLREAQAKLKDDGLSPTTINDVMFKVVRQCLDHAVESGWLTTNPASSIKPLKRLQPIRQQPAWKDAWRIIEESCQVSPESGDLLRFMLAFGIGQKEIKFLRGEHVDLQREVIDFYRKKTGKAFQVPIFKHAKPIIEKLRADGRIQVGKSVFAWRGPEQALHGACRRLGVPEYSPRALRRSFIIYNLESGVDPRVVAKWQGHRDAKLILDTYGAFVSKEHEQAQIAKLAGKSNPT